MAVILRSDIAGDFIINEQGWVILVPFAYQNGWRPKGTREPAHYELLHDDVRPQGWHPANYFQGKGQRVSGEDAAAFADALESALPDLPDHDPLADKAVGKIEAPGFPRITATSSDLAPTPFEVFGGANKARLRVLIAFCRAGPLTIW